MLECESCGRWTHEWIGITAAGCGWSDVAFCLRCFQPVYHGLVAEFGRKAVILHAHDVQESVHGLMLEVRGASPGAESSGARHREQHVPGSTSAAQRGPGGGALPNRREPASPRQAQQLLASSYDLIARSRELLRVTTLRLQRRRSTPDSWLTC